jgi:hypothetical protein
MVTSVSLGWSISSSPAKLARLLPMPGMTAEQAEPKGGGST